MTAPLLECIAAACGYQGKPVLAGVDLAISAGDSVALLGPNGSGKSTLLKSITREIPLISGKILLSGEPTSSLSAGEIARRAAVVPQEELPQFAFTVREAVTLGCLVRSRGLFDTPEDAEKATEAMQMIDCLHLADRAITELSGGERQRVLLARAIAQDAPLVLLDEPTSHLDPLHQVELSKLVRDLARQGRGILAAIHDLNLAGEMASHALLIGRSGVLAHGPMEEVLRSPALEEAYGVAFERIETKSGVLVRALSRTS